MSSRPQAAPSQAAQPEPARRPSSQRRIRSSRANGALSRGPKTPEGKQRSSRNATRHGIFAGPDLLPHESPGSYHQLRQAYFRCFAPQDPLTRRLVQQLVSAVWRLRRLWGIETAAFDRELPNHLLPSGPERLAAAFTSLAVRSRQLDLVHRYETRLHLICRRALRSLVDLRNARVQIEP